MISKKFTPKRTSCKIIFSFPASKVTSSVAVVGDFNNWDSQKGEMKLKGDVYTLTQSFKPNTTIKFRYFIDGTKWENEADADRFTANEFGSEDSIVEIGK